jgi:hypothetical protein
MHMDALESAKFMGLVAITVEKELGASIYDDEAKGFAQEILDDFIAAGMPRNKKQWLKQEISNRFLSATNPPKWVEPQFVPRWPFHDKKPMVFIGTIRVPENHVSKTMLSTGTSLFIFGGRKPTQHGFEMVYKVVSQHSKSTDDPPISRSDLKALFDYLDRPRSSPCTHTYKETTAFLKERDLPVDETIQWLQNNGGGCDCEVILNTEATWGNWAGRHGD